MACTDVQVVIDSFDPGLLVSAPVVKVLDFSTVKEEDLYNIEIPLLFNISKQSPKEATCSVILY